ncbi:MAG: sulfatase-like hydrolase/transferase, partial [Planctomycetaceae bacterium]
QAALRFMDTARQARRPFFVYLPTNAPHGPFHDVPPDLLRHYQSKPMQKLIVGQTKPARLQQERDRLARIAAMITNVDQNVGRLFDRLNDWGISRNTLVMFLVDNGPNSRRFVGPWRGSKTQVHEGGVRSPLWLHWPAKLTAGTQRRELSAHIDLMPTILDACGVAAPAGVALDGRSLLPLLLGRTVDWSDRTVVIQSHRGDQPVRYHNFMIRGGRWKLLQASGFGQSTFSGPPKFELYDLVNDPGETRNLAREQSDVLARLKAAYDTWFDDVGSTRPDNYAPPRIHVGTAAENPTVLTRQDWRGGSWAAKAIGHWELFVARPRRFEVKLLFDPGQIDERVTLKMGTAVHRRQISAGDTSCVFSDIQLKPGQLRLQAVLEQAQQQRGVYQAIVRQTGSLD